MVEYSLVLENTSRGGNSDSCDLRIGYYTFDKFLRRQESVADLYYNRKYQINDTEYTLLNDSATPSTLAGTPKAQRQ